MNTTKLFKTLICTLMALVSATALRAATVSFTLELNSTSGTYSVFAEASAGDNDGISSFGVPLQNVLTVSNVSPQGLNGSGLFGFDTVRSGANVTTLTGAQALVPTTVVYNFGQSAGNLMTDHGDLGISPPAVQNSGHAAKLLLATGTYDLGGAQPAVNDASADFGAGVFDLGQAAAMGSSRSGATPSWSTTTVPEPTTIGLLGLGGLALFLRRRPIE